MGDDDVERVLLAVAQPAENDGRRQALLDQTTRLLRRRRGMKNLGLIAALISAYGAGIGSMSFLMKTAPAPIGNPLVVSSAMNTTRESAPSTPAVAVESVAVPLEIDPDAPAVVLERVGATLSAERRSAFYRRAGDLYLDVEGDMASAIRCYKLSLDAASDKQLVISTSDNWLLMALKKSRQGENRYAKSNS